MIVIYVAFGGFIGAILRYAISKRLNRVLPYGTILVNILGSFLLGYCFYKGITSNVYALLGSGFCGAFTTFSTFNLEIVKLYQDNQKWESILYLIISYLIGFLFAFLGFLSAKI